jgi:hypothetical protein
MASQLLVGLAKSAAHTFVSWNAFSIMPSHRVRLGTKLISLLLLSNAVFRHPALEGRILLLSRARVLLGSRRRAPEIGTSMASRAHRAVRQDRRGS